MTDLDLLTERLCPYCLKGPWVVPLSHVARAHRVPGPEVRARLGLKPKGSVTAPGYRQWRAEENRRLAAELPTRYPLYACATCGVEFRGPRFRDGQGVPRYCSVNCKRKGRR